MHLTSVCLSANHIQTVLSCGTKFVYICSSREMNLHGNIIYICVDYKEINREKIKQILVSQIR
jgi:hypothetical protein